ncbi:MAG: F0F1 ATP synthase subunit A [Acidimicrobiia bacterium]
MIALEFPPINAILRWQDVAPSFNKIAIIAVLATIIGCTIFTLAARADARKAPRGARNHAETSVEFIESGVIMQTMGRDGLGWTPFLLTLFRFVYLCDVPGIIPFFQTCTARDTSHHRLSLHGAPSRPAQDQPRGGTGRGPRGHQRLLRLSTGRNDDAVQVGAWHTLVHDAALVPCRHGRLQLFVGSQSCAPTHRGSQCA